jgi:hypothetical protein
MCEANMYVFSYIHIHFSHHTSSLLNLKKTCLLPVFCHADLCAGVVCSAEQCHVPGTCQSGNCTEPALSDNGIECEYATNMKGSCQSGACGEFCMVDVMLS